MKYKEAYTIFFHLQEREPNSLNCFYLGNISHFLGRDDEGRLISVTKSFNPDRDFKMAMICHQLIMNIINTRKLYYFKEEKEPIFYFHKYDLFSINYPKDDLIRTSKTIYWQK